MGYKMKGMSFMQGQSPMRKVNAGGKKKEKVKTIAGEDTDDVIRKDKKGKDYVLSAWDNASGIRKGDTLFAPKYKIPSAYGYVMGGENYDAIETEDSKKRKKGPKSYTLKTQPPPTKLKSKSKRKKESKLTKTQDRKQPTFEGTDEYRKPENIPASEYKSRGLDKKTVVANYYKKKKKK